MFENVKIGVFDSGIGGLSVVKEIIKEMPYLDIVYIADTAHVPYGNKTFVQLKEYVYDIIKFFKKNNINIVVMACNTSSSLILPYAKKDFPDMQFLGVVDYSVVNAIKETQNGNIGVIANEATTKSNIFKNKINKFDKKMNVYQQACPQLVPLIEDGQINNANSLKALNFYLNPLRQKNIDTLILGCTHYPFLKKQIKEILPYVKIIDPASYLASSLKDILETKNIYINKEKNAQYTFYLTAFNTKFSKLAAKFLNFSNVIAYPLNIKEALEIEKVG